MSQPFSDISANYIRTHLRKGDILFWEGFDFGDGTPPQPKYLLLLSDCLAGEIFIVVLPTSQIDKYFGLQSQRSIVDIVKIKKGEADFFKKETIIDLKECRAVFIEKMVEVYDGKTLKRTGSLSIDIIRRIDEAVENAKTLSQKIKDIILNSEIADSNTKT